jgi:hypothetical protein
VIERPIVNASASVHARLLNRSRETKEDFQFLLQRYASERFLYRLGESLYRKDYVLKGAMLFALWGGSVYRPTRDLDFTGYGSDDTGDVIKIFSEVCVVAVPEDGLAFDAKTVAAEPIRDEAEYNGMRVTFIAHLGTARIPMQIDIGFGNAIEPAANDVRYPTLLDAPAPNVRAYPHEAVVAEKLHALVILGERNSRMKDFYDLYTLATQFGFDGETLAGAIAATFSRRKTKIEPSLPAALTGRFFQDDRRAEMWRGYLTRNRILGAPGDFAQVGERITGFLGPIWTALATGDTSKLHWQSGSWGGAS